MESIDWVTQSTTPLALYCEPVVLITENYRQYRHLPKSTENLRKRSNNYGIGFYAFRVTDLRLFFGSVVFGTFRQFSIVLSNYTGV